MIISGARSSEVIKSGSMSEWIKYQPQRVGRSPSSLLNNHKMSEQDRVEETALLNNTYHNTWGRVNSLFSKMQDKSIILNSDWKKNKIIFLDWRHLFFIFQYIHPCTLDDNRINNSQHRVIQRLGD